MFTEEKDGLKLLRFDTFKEEPGLQCAVSTRQGGYSSGPFGGLNLGAGPRDDKRTLAKNLALFCGAFGTDPAKVATMRQRHTANVAVVEEGGGEPAENADAIVTAMPGVALITRSADCALTAFYDKEHRALAVMHSGWRGALMNIYSSVLNVMRLRFGTEPGDLVAAVSPMISSAHYPVREDFLEKLKAFYPEGGHLRFITVRDGLHFFSMRELLRFQLDVLGIKKHEFMHLCTYEHKELFYSWRRDGAATGHFALMAMLK